MVLGAPGLTLHTYFVLNSSTSLSTFLYLLENFLNFHSSSFSSSPPLNFYFENHISNSKNSGLFSGCFFFCFLQRTLFLVWVWCHHGPFPIVTMVSKGSSSSETLSIYENLGPIPNCGA